jgi:hypothetical protein
MTLFPFRDFFTQQNRQLENWDAAKVISFKLCTGYQQEVGSIRDLLVDEHGHFRYLVVDIKLEDIEKGILLPIGLAHLDYEKGEAIVHRLKPVLLKKLPSYQLGQTIDDRFEQRVRDVLLPIASCRMGRQFLQQPYTHNGQYQGVSSGYTPSSSRNYNHFPNFYGMSEEDNQRPLKQLENQLI